MKPLRILHTLAPAPAGGLERVVQELATGQHRRGHQVRVLAIVDPGPPHPFATPLVEKGVDVRLATLPGRAYLATLRTVQRELADFRPDLVHTHGYRSDLLDAEVARIRKLPTVTTVHGSSFLGGASRLFERIQLWGLRRFDAVISVSAPLTRTLLEAGVPPDRLHTLPNAWSGREPRLSREEALRALGMDPADPTPVVGFVGRLIPVKNPGLLVEALGRIADLPWRGVIVGEGPERPALEAALGQAGLSGRVHLAGAAEDAAALYPAFDLFVLSSRSEGTPIVLFEAMAARVPVVATSVGGVPEVLGPGGGWLTGPGDPEAMAGAIRAALEDPGEARGRAGRARERLQEVHHPDRWIDRHEDVYRAIVARRL